MEYLFEKKRFDEYRNNDEIKKYLEKEKLELLDKDELKEKLKGDFTEELVKYFDSELCKNNINYFYILEVFKEAFKDDNKEFEIIFLINKENGDIYGFLISQLGECEIYKDAYVLNLICSKKSAPLLGAYLYMIKKFEGKPQIGILELAGSYTNTQALCAYNKFGFYPNTQLRDCFSVNMTMTMSLHLYSLDDIINTVVTGINIDKDNNFDIDLCNRFAIKDKMNLKIYKKKLLLKIQNKMALLYNNIYSTNSDINKLKIKFDRIINNNINNNEIIKNSIKDSIKNSKKDSIKNIKKDIIKNSINNIIKDSEKDSIKDIKKDSIKNSKNTQKSIYKRFVNPFRRYTRKKTQLL